MDGHTSVCRICLKNGATLPIFETEEAEESVLSKLCLCLNESIEDVAGYPRNICELCHITLNTTCKFINQYKNSCKLLENGLQIIIKQEVAEESDYFCDDQTEYDLKDVKFQPKVELDAKDFMKLVKPLKKFKKEHKPKIKKENIKSSVKISKHKTNKIASSILEGNFIWKEEKWCMDSCKNSLPVNKKTTKEKQKRQKERSLRLNYVQKPVKPPPLPREALLCDLCGEIFKNRDNLTGHKQKVHFKRLVKCPICFKDVSSEYLKRHTLRVHSQKCKNYVCSACGRAFAFANELNRHYKMVHDKEKYSKTEYACKICHKKYACAKSVLIHERSAHTGERPATCSVCGNSFYHEDYLREHMRLHTGETPYKCPVCGRGYAQRGNMRSHLRIHRISDLDAATLSKIKPNYLKYMKM